MTVLRSSLELRGQRLPSTNAAKAKTWVQMLGIGFVVLIARSSRRAATWRCCSGCRWRARLITMLILRFTPRRRFRPIEFAATVLIGFLTAALLGGAPATRATVLAFVVAMTWYSAHRLHRRRASGSWCGPTRTGACTGSGWSRAS